MCGIKSTSAESCIISVCSYCQLLGFSIMISHTD